MILGSFLTIMVVLVIWRRNHQRYVQEKFEHQVFALRDKLRRLAIEGKISEDNWAFHYVDNALSTSINESYFTTLFYFIARGSSIKTDERYHKFVEEFSKAMVENPAIDKIVKNHLAAIREYLKGQHLISDTLMRPIFQLIHVMSAVRKRVKDSIRHTIYKENINNPNVGGFLPC